MLKWIIVSIWGIPVLGCAQNWQSVGNFNMYPTSIFADSTSGLLFAGGYFTEINNIQRWGIATWNNSNWDSLGLGIDNDSISTPGTTKGFLHDANYLYAIGSFRRAGTVNTNGIARWNGASWDSVPGCKIASNQEVNDIIKFNGDIYICGNFDSVGSLPAHGLAMWNGSSWITVGGNYDFATLGFINRVRFYHGNLYVSGNFPDNNGNTCRLAKWDGFNWYFMTSAVQGSIAAIQDMEVFQDKLYVAGLYFQSSGNVANCLQTWNDTTWSGVGGSVQILANQNPTIRDLCVHNNLLYCCGNFEKIGGVLCNAISIWNGTDWCGLGSTFNGGGVNQIEFYNDTMYVIGGFTSIDQVSATYVAKWLGGNYIDTCGHLTTSIEEIYQSVDVQLWPNPTSESLHFKLYETGTQHLIIVHDSFGREIWRKETVEDGIDFPSFKFSNGLYFYTISEGDVVVSNGKFTVQH
jgi:hypothetical protein